MHCSERQNFVFGVHFIIISDAVDALLVVLLLLCIVRVVLFNSVTRTLQTFKCAQQKLF